MSPFALPPPSAPVACSLERLTERQSECLVLASHGLTSAAIAARLGVSPRTVDEHLLGACRTLQVRTRIQAVARLALHQRQRGEPLSFDL